MIASGKQRGKPDIKGSMIIHDHEDDKFNTREVVVPRLSEDFREGETVSESCPAIG